MELNEEEDEATAITSVVIYRTALDGGSTELFAVGKYFDTVSLAGDGPLLKSRNVRLDTRELGIGSHMPP